MRISDWSSDVCSSDLWRIDGARIAGLQVIGRDHFRDQRRAVDQQQDETAPDAEPVAAEFPPHHLPLRGAVETLLLRRQGFGVIGIEGRSEERRGGKEWVRTWRSRWSPSNQKKNIKKKQELQQR